MKADRYLSIRLAPSGDATDFTLSEYSPSGREWHITHSLAHIKIELARIPSIQLRVMLAWMQQRLEAAIESEYV